MEYDFINGEVLLINKPLNWTSFDVVNKVRRTILRKTKSGKIKVGHSGTLDPLATGLLIICTGKYTKRIHEFQNLDKEYTGSFYLGATTPSFDSETEIDSRFETDHINDELLYNTTKTFIGELDQEPPLYSAINVNGERAYHKARKKEIVRLAPKKITIKEFELTSINLPAVHFRIVCSKGTYIRALARDFGIMLNSGAYLTQLTRTKIGEFSLSNAITMDQFEDNLNTIDLHGLKI